MALASLILGIFGLIAWIFPFIGYPVTIIGICLGFSAKKKGQTRFVKAGIVLSIIGLVLTLINSAVGMYLGATGQLFN